MDIARSFTFIFQDREWTNRMSLGAAISFVPILNFASVGYEVETARRVMRGESCPLPTWDELGRKWKDGLILLLARLIYYLPFYLLMCGPLTLFVSVPFMPDEQSAKAAAGTVLLIWSLACSAGLFLAIIIGFLSPAISLQYVRRGTFAACFDMAAILGTIRNHTSEYLLAWLGVVCASLIYSLGVMIASGLLSWIPGVGWVAQIVLIGVGIFWANVVTGHLVGQLGLVQSESLKG